jgi:hypothetical protein
MDLRRSLVAEFDTMVDRLAAHNHDVDLSNAMVVLH